MEISFFGARGSGNAVAFPRSKYGDIFFREHAAAQVFFFAESLRRAETLRWAISPLRGLAFPRDEKKTAKLKKVKESSFEKTSTSDWKLAPSPGGAKLFSVGQADLFAQPYENGKQNKARCKRAIAGTHGKKSPAESPRAFGGEDVHVFVAGRGNAARRKENREVKES
ncbi:MAG: hypothetical protein ACI4P3_01810 [Candidatus Spyradosoma sp.]